MKRRDFLAGGGLLFASTLVSSLALDTIFIENARGAAVPLGDLQARIPASEGTVLVPQDKRFAAYQMAFNRRTLKTPLVRVLCATPNAVAKAIAWARENDVPLAMRSGGHSFEGFSQSTGLVIDTRPMNRLSLAADGQSFVSGAGAMLGNVYAELAKRGLSVPAGSCPTVGITGHTLGGGYGLLSRPFGLAADSLVAVELVNAEGKVLVCREKENADLFWALRGGGAGSFGVVTQLQFRTHPLKAVVVYSMRWRMNARQATRLMRAWQQWAPQSPREITSLMKVARVDAHTYNLRCVGQSVGSAAALQREIGQLGRVQAADSTSTQPMDFMGAVRHFGGRFEAKPVFMKGKSDYLTEVMSEADAELFLAKMPLGVEVAFDSYGGAISDVADDATAFSHRQALSSLQYYTQWESPAEGTAKMAALRQYHGALRPMMSGGAYFNYCDLDIKDSARAYWGSNLERLVEVKVAHDPENVFRHAQSIPLKI